MTYYIGIKINHCIFGKGRILDRGLEKDTYRIEFEKPVDGMKIRNINKDRIYLC